MDRADLVLLWGRSFCGLLRGWSLCTRRSRKWFHIWFGGKRKFLFNPLTVSKDTTIMIIITIKCMVIIITNMQNRSDVTSSRLLLI